MLLGLSTGHAIGLGLIAAAFVVFSLLCALVIPKRWPQFPGERGLRWFIVVTVVLCIGTLAAVEVFATEAEEETAQAETTGTTSTGTTRPGRPRPPRNRPRQRRASRRPVSPSSRPRGAAAATRSRRPARTVRSGPTSTRPCRARTRPSCASRSSTPTRTIASGYQPNIMPGNFGQTLTPKQIDDLVAFLTKPS